MIRSKTPLLTTCGNFLTPAVSRFTLLRKAMMTLEQKVDHSRDVPWLELNCDKTVSVLVRTSEIEYLETYSHGVFRKMIERLGGEIARSTTLVKYEPNRSFPRHVHSGGEEFFVLDGVWKDEYGTFPKYSYVRNYIGSGHAPQIGDDGCLILVKLRQMSHTCQEPDHMSVNASPQSNSWRETKIGDTTKKVKRLYSSPLEKVTAEIWPANSIMEIEVPQNGKEVFVVDGSFTSEMFGNHDKFSWTRLTKGIQLGSLLTGPNEPLFLYVKEAHLSSHEESVDTSLRPKDWKQHAKF